MSYQLMAWAAEQTTGSITRKAVLLSLANAANHHTGRCFPSVERIARETEASERTVRRALDELESAGLITRERRRREDGTLGTYEYAFPADNATASPPDTDDRTSGQPRPQPAVRATALNQEDEQEGEQETDTARAREPEGATIVLSSGPPEQYQAPTTVDRKRVTSEEATRAGLILHVWNRETGQRLRAKEWLGKIIMRLREYPEATPSDHEFIIRCALAKPWWRGDPSPSVVYGNGAQFERALTEARSAAERGAGGDDERIRRIVEAARARRAA